MPISKGETMKPASLIIKTLLAAVVLLHAASAVAQSARQNQGPPPPPKAPAYRIVTEASAPKGWKRYEFGVTVPVVGVLLPSIPEETIERKSFGGPKPSTMYTYTSESEDAVYAVFYAEDMPFVAERMPEDFKQSFYKGMLEGFINGIKKGISQSGLLFEVEVGEQRKTKIEGLDGAEMDFSFGPMKGLARLTISGQRAYMAFAMWMEETPQSERSTFFNSFRILKR